MTLVSHPTGGLLGDRLGAFPLSLDLATTWRRLLQVADPAGHLTSLRPRARRRGCEKWGLGTYKLCFLVYQLFVYIISYLENKEENMEDNMCLPTKFS